MDKMNKKIKELHGRLDALINDSVDTLKTLYDKDVEQSIIDTLKDTNTDSQTFDTLLCKIFYNGYDPDSSPIAWHYYANLYVKSTDCTSNKYNFCEKFSNGGRHKALPYHRITKNSISRISVYLNNDLSILIKHKDNDVEFSGDCCFNFNQSKKIAFNKIINKTNKNQSKEILNLTQKMHHSPLNFALIPINGGMNKIKGDGEHGLDRFDVFISALYLFFKNKKNPTAIKLIGEFETSQNGLVSFLNNIKTFDDYCKLFYPELTIELRKDLIKSGKKPIDSTKRIIEYIELAVRFWEAKAKYYDKQTGN